VIKVAIIIASDTRSKGVNKDETIPLLSSFFEKNDWVLVDSCIVPDEVEGLKNMMIYYADAIKADLILVSGGTGPSKRDVTPEATRMVIDYEMPGISEIMRVKNFEFIKVSVLSRGISGVRGDTLIINLPGNPQGAIDSLSVVSEVIPHCIEIIQGKGGNHGRNSKGTKQD